jgi:hypothetical protein
MIHLGKHSKSRIVSKGISAGFSQNSYRGLVQVARKADGSKNFSQCDSLLLGDKCGAHTFPYLEVKNNTSSVEHEATTSKIGEDQIFYCNQRGLSTETAVALIVNGYAKALDTDALFLRRSDLFFMNIRLLFPAFCLYGIGVSIVVLNACIFFFRKLSAAKLLRFIQTISSMKYSVVLFYTLIGALTISATNVEFFSKPIALILYVVLATVLTFYLPFLWRKKIAEQGPMEYFIKRISGSAKK